MSEQLEAAVESLRQADLAADESEREKSLTAFGDAVGHLKNAVNHLAGAVQELEQWRGRAHVSERRDV